MRASHARHVMPKPAKTSVRPRRHASAGSWMTDNTTIILALISLVGTIVTASITAYVLIKVGHVETKTTDLAKSVDGQMTKLLEASIGKAHAEGVTTGEQSQRDRASAPEGSEPIPVTIANPPDAPVPVDQAPPKP